MLIKSVLQSTVFIYLYIYRNVRFIEKCPNYVHVYVESRTSPQAGSPSPRFGITMSQALAIDIKRVGAATCHTTMLTCLKLVWNMIGELKLLLSTEVKS